MLVDWGSCWNKIDYERIDSAMSLRKTGGKYASKRKEEDKVEFISGVNEGFTTSEPILITIQNQDGKRKTTHSFLTFLDLVIKIC